MSTHFVATKPPPDRPAAAKSDATESAATTSATTRPDATTDATRDATTAPAATAAPVSSVSGGAATPSDPVGSSTAVLLPAAPSRRVASTPPATDRRSMPPVAATDRGSTEPASGAAGALVGASIDAAATTPAPPDEDGEIRRPDGYVVFAVGDACFAVPVDEVRAVIRTERLDLLPGGERPRYGRGVALVDVRGRAIPVVDLRSDPDVAGEVLLPLYRHHVGLVVDRVVSVSSSRELVPEPDGLPDVLPAYARGVLRPAEGGPAVLLVGLPDAEFLQG